MNIDPSFPVPLWLLGLTALALALVSVPILALFERSEARMRADRLIARIARRSARGQRAPH